MIISIVVVLLSVIGLWISFYFTGVFYKRISPDAAWIPSVCRMKEESCQTILETPQARTFGLPNSVFGILLYAYLIIDQFWFAPYVGLIALVIAVLKSLYLAYNLIYVIKVPCPLCFASHIINLVLFLAVLNQVLFS